MLFMKKWLSSKVFSSLDSSCRLLILTAVCLDIKEHGVDQKSLILHSGLTKKTVINSIKKLVNCNLVKTIKSSKKFSFGKIYILYNNFDNGCREYTRAGVDSAISGVVVTPVAGVVQQLQVKENQELATPLEAIEERPIKQNLEEKETSRANILTSAQKIQKQEPKKIEKMNFGGCDIFNLESLKIRKTKDS